MLYLHTAYVIRSLYDVVYSVCRSVYWSEHNVQLTVRIVYDVQCTTYSTYSVRSYNVDYDMQHILSCTLDVVHCTPYIVEYFEHNRLSRTLYAVHCILCDTVHRVQCTMYIQHIILHLAYIRNNFSIIRNEKY